MFYISCNSLLFLIFKRWRTSIFNLRVEWLNTIFWYNENFLSLLYFFPTSEKVVGKCVRYAFKTYTVLRVCSWEKFVVKFRYENLSQIFVTQMIFWTWKKKLEKLTFEIDGKKYGESEFLPLKNVVGRADEFLDSKHFRDYLSTCYGLFSFSWKWKIS